MKRTSPRRIFFHGTGARRRESIGEKGIVPRGESYVYATSNVDVAAVFAAARADHEGDDGGMVISFASGEGWEIDPRFPDSYMRKESVPPGDILIYTHMQPSEELREKVKEYGIKMEE